jgi:hypothetical protein
MLRSRLKIFVAALLVFWGFSGLTTKSHSVHAPKSGTANYYMGQNIFFDVALLEKGDSVILALKNKGDDTVNYYLGFFGKDSGSTENKRFDCNLLVDTKFKKEKMSPQMLQVMPRSETMYRSRLSKEMFSSLHGFFRYKFFIGARSGSSWNYLNLRQER